MTRDDINYWMSPKFDHVPPTDEELKAGRLITKSQHARTLSDQIRSMVASNFPLADIVSKLDHLVSMVKDDEPEPDADARLIDAAPDLLAAAERLEKRIAFYASMAEADQPNIEQWAYTDGSGDVAALRAAIANATGEQQ